MCLHVHAHTHTPRTRTRLAPLHLTSVDLVSVGFGDTGGSAYSCNCDPHLVKGRDKIATFFCQCPLRSSNQSYSLDVPGGCVSIVQQTPNCLSVWFWYRALAHEKFTK